MKNEMYGFIYCTTNLVNGKKYIGQHKYCGRIDKYYLGSGVALNNAIKKYGRENFKREIICECKSLEELNNKEIYYINLLDAVNDSKYYNIDSGGNGGHGNQWWKTATQEQIDQSNKIRSIKMSGKNNPFYGKKHTLETRKLLSEKASLRKADKNPFYGKKHTEQNKKKISDFFKGLQVGDKNPFYGKKHTLETKKLISKLAKERTNDPNYISPKSMPVILEDLKTGNKLEFPSRRKCFEYLVANGLNVRETRLGNNIFKFNTFRSLVQNKNRFNNILVYKK